MRFQSFTRAALLPFVLAVVGGCTSNLGPGDAAGTYVLRSIAGDALPARQSDGGIEGPPIVTADTIRIRADGTGSRAITYASANFIGGGDPSPFQSVWVLSAHVDGHTVTLAYACPPNASCGSFTARLTASGLTIDANGSERGPEVYQRISRDP